MFRKNLRSVVGSMLILLVAAVGVRAQLATADMVGTVTDNTGAVVPQAHVTATHLGTGTVRTVDTDQSGEFTFSKLQTGDYSVAVEAGGFQKFVVPSVTLASGDRARVNAQLSLGEVSQKVEVQATVPALQTESATLGALIDQKRTQDLPISGRTFMTLAQLIPGAIAGATTGSVSSGTRVDDRRVVNAVSVGGVSDTWNNKLVDGMDNNERAINTIGVTPSLEGIQEVKVQTNDYNAEVGRTGGAVVDVITKSGTNNFHGSVYEYFRHEDLTARDYFNRATLFAKPAYRQNQFGGSLGGPIRREKTFFFADYEELKVNQGLQLPLVTIPSACELGRAACNGVTQLGNFSDISTKIYDPATGLQFPNNIIPSKGIPQVSRNIASLYPSPNLAGFSNNYTGNASRTQTYYTADAKVDHHFSDKTFVAVRYTINDVTTFIPGTFPTVSINGTTLQAGGDARNYPNQFAGPASERAQNLAGSYTRLFSPNLVFQASASYLRILINSGSLNTGTNAANVLGFQGINFAPYSTGMPEIFVTGYNQVGDADYTPDSTYDNTGQYLVSLSWTKGSHNLKFGTGLVRRLFGNIQSAYPNYQFTFNQQMTSSGLSTSTSGGNSFASLLLGLPTVSQRLLATTSPLYGTWEPSGYVQDYWRVNSRLTLNLGARYDVFTPWTEENNLLSNFDPVRGVLFTASGSDKTAGVQTDWSNFAPRVGFAYSVTPKTVIRGGWGASFQQPGQNSQSQLKNPPFTSNYQVNTPSGLPFGSSFQSITQVFPGLSPNSITNPPGQIFGISADYKSNVVYGTNLNVQREFAGNVVSIGYVGVFSRHLNLNPNIDSVNTPGPQPAGTKLVSVPSPAQPYFSKLPLVTSITMQQDEGNANYNGMILSLERRYNNGLSFSTSYTYAHALDNVTINSIECIYPSCIMDIGNGKGGVNEPVTTIAGNRYDYGNGNFDTRNRFVVSLTYELPVGHAMQGLSRVLVQGWQGNTIFTYSSGQPVTVYMATPNSQTFNNAQQNVGGSRPVVIANPVLPNPSPTAWFNAAAFATPAIGTIGDERRGSFNGPPQRRWDISLFKSFMIREPFQIQFRGELYNVTNTPNFNQPNASFGGGGFGTITSTAPGSLPRTAQLALKILF